MRGTGTPKDRDEVNRREVCECDGCVGNRIVYFQQNKKKAKAEGKNCHVTTM